MRRAGLPSEFANSVEAGGSDGDQAVPYLQLDVPNHYPVEVKRGLARRLGENYARIMQTTPDMVTVAFRELGEGGVLQRRRAGTGSRALMRHTAGPAA